MDVSQLVQAAGVSLLHLQFVSPPPVWRRGNNPHSSTLLMMTVAYY